MNPQTSQGHQALPPPNQIASVIQQRATAAGRPLPPEVLQEIAKQQATVQKGGQLPAAALQGLNVLKQQQAQKQAQQGAPQGHAPMPPQGQAPQGIGGPPGQGQQIPPQVLQAMMAQKAQQQAQPGGGQPPQGMPPRPPMPPQGQAPQGTPPQGGPPGQGQQIPPALLQQMMQRAQAQGGQPGQPPQGMPQRPAMPPQGQGQAGPPQGMPQQGQPPQQAPQAPPPPSLQPRMMPPAQGISGGVSPLGGQIPQQAPPSGPPGSQGAQQAQPGMRPFAQTAQGGAPVGQTRMTPSEMAALGRGGDSIVAHLTPGEIAIPKELQTPQLLAAIAQSAHRFGIQPAQLQAGSGQVPRNPNTGAEEHSIWSDIIPAIAMAATAYFAPELLPLIGAEGGSVLGTAALVGGVGAASTYATGGNAEQSLLAGAVGALTGGMGAAGGAADVANQAAAASTSGVSTGVDQALSNAAGAYAGGTQDLAQAGADMGVNSSTLATPTLTSASVAPTQAAGAALPANASTGQQLAGAGKGLSGLFSGMSGQTQAALLAGGGGALSGILGASMATPTTAPLPPGFNSLTPTPLPAANPNFGAMLGSNQTNQPTFAGYNPYQSVTGINPLTGAPANAGFSFFPQQSSGSPSVPANAAPALAGGATVNSQPSLVNALQS
jgi:hypothetical protein